MRKIFSRVFLMSMFVLFSMASMDARTKTTNDYPKDEIANAEHLLGEGLKNNNSADVVEGVMSLVSAKMSVSLDYAPELIAKIDSVISVRPDDVAGNALLRFCELNLYKNVKNEVADGRNESVETAATDISEWSKKQFDEKMQSIIDEMLANADALWNTPIDKYDNVMLVTEENKFLCPNLYCFLAEKVNSDYGYRRLSKIDYLDYIIKNSDDKLKIFYSLEKAGISWNYDSVMAFYNEWKHSEYSGLAFNKLAKYEIKSLNLGQQRELYGVLNDFIAKWKDYKYIGDLVRLRNIVEAKTVVLSYRSVASSSDDMAVDYTAKNIAQFKINLYRLNVKGASDFDFYKVKKGKIKKQLVASEVVGQLGDLPYEYKGTVTVASRLAYGLYIMEAEYMDADGKQVSQFVDYPIYVTDLMPVASGVSSRKRVFVLDGKTGFLVDNSLVTVNHKNDKSVTRKVGKSGLDISSDGSCDITAKRGKDIFGNALYVYNYHSYNQDFILNCSVTTDLGVYRPGDVVKFAAVVYGTDTKNRHRFPVKNLNCRVKLINSNNETVDSINLNTDDYGRIAGEFGIPKNVLNGTFNINLVTDKYKGEEEYGNTSFSVADFKMPTFFVAFDKESVTFREGEKVELAGTVKTYTDIPLKNTLVTLDLKKHEWRWWWRAQDSGIHVESFNVETDDKGRFSIVIPEKCFGQDEDSDYGGLMFYSYTLNASATSVGGETQSSTASFTVGSHVEIIYNSKDQNVLAQTDVLLPIVITSNVSESPSCNVKISDKTGKPVISTRFTTGKTKLDFSALPSGEYTLEAGIDDLSEPLLKQRLVVYRADDILAPCEDVLWVASREFKATNPDQVSLLAACGKADAQVMVLVACADKVLGDSWIVLKKGMNKIPIDISKALPGVPVTVRLFTVNDYKAHKENVTILPYEKPEALNITIESFRDKVLSGDTETWKFSFNDQNGNAQSGALLMNVYNKAIDSIVPTRFAFSIGNSYRQLEYGIIPLSYIDRYYSELLSIADSKIKVPQIVFPKLLYNFARRYFKFYGGMERLQAMGAKAPMLDGEQYLLSVDDSLALNEVVTVAEDSGAAIPESPVESYGFKNMELREDDVKNALWLPFISTDKNGNAYVQFQIPNVNTTWVMSGFGYDKDMVSSTIKREFTSSKPIMAQSNLPRFVRIGDNISLSATVTNSSDTVQSVTALVELFDIDTDSILASKTFNFAIEAGNHQALFIEWNAPEELSYVGFRVKASNGKYGDGEQKMIPVLPSISPVVESEQFYMNHGENQASFVVPAITNGSKVSFEYCNNPVWACVMALPSIFDVNRTITATSLMHNYYALLMAQGIASDNPIIRDAVSHWQANPQDSVLVSSLEKNKDLKIHDLALSPWLGAAKRQTLQMQGIKNLFDDNYNKVNRDEALRKLLGMQCQDGGWSWIKGFQSSYHTTLEVLQLLGELKQLGYLPEDASLDDAIERAIKYIDVKVVEYYNEYSDKKDYSFFYDYAYVRMFFKEIEQSAMLDVFSKKAVAEIAKSWHGTSMACKAYAAIILKEYGYDYEASRIVESISQHSIDTKNKGTYWDNLQQGYGRYFHKTALTSLMLQAISKVNPQSPIVDKVRQWLLINKQTNDWGSSSMATDAIYTILNCGNNWLKESSVPEITVAGKKIEFGSFDKYLGYGVADIEFDANLKGDVSIVRNGDNPAWGALYWKYKAPMTSVKAAKSDGIEISKKFMMIDGNKLVEKKSFGVGDKVRVMLMVKTKQDLDYVTITDERCSCSEPADQITKSEIQNGVWLMRETKDSQTNIFIQSLPKGTHIIYYDATITATGSYNMGIASVQCQYAPQYAAHSSGSSVIVK